MCTNIRGQAANGGWIETSGDDPEDEDDNETETVFIDKFRKNVKIRKRLMLLMECLVKKAILER